MINPAGREISSDLQSRCAVAGDDRSWLRLVERVLASWPATLRLALFLLILFTGIAVVATALGVAGQILLTVLGFRIRKHR